MVGSASRRSAHVIEDGGTRSLRDVIDAAPLSELGERSVAQFGERLPFLLKVLAAEEPLSLQAHPSAEQAREGSRARTRWVSPWDFGGTQLPRREPQAGTGRRASPGSRRWPVSGIRTPHRAVPAGARGRTTCALRRSAGRSAGPGRSARTVHDVDHAAVAGTVGAVASRARRLCSGTCRGPTRPKPSSSPRREPRSN